MSASTETTDSHPFFGGRPNESLTAAEADKLWIGSTPHLHDRDAVQLYKIAAGALSLLVKIARDAECRPDEPIAAGIQRRTSERVEWMRNACIQRIKEGVNP